MSSRIAIINNGTGNLHSVFKTIKSLGAEAVITSQPQEVGVADKIILPGVGHFGTAMKSLQVLNLIDCLHENVLVKQKPILGICLGLQMMAASSEEAPAIAGLGWFSGNVIRFVQEQPVQYKVPHTGWNGVRICKQSALMKAIPDHTEFYFVHAYHYHATSSTEVLNETEYGYKFASAIQKDHIFGVQYHPEKSHDAGLQLFKNFLSI